jgi:DNA-binding response OmpR family regulator
VKADAKKILWVDDEIDRLQSHIIFLEGRGFEITPASSGEDALVEVEKSNFDLILLDEMMPGMDGLTTLEEIKKRKPHIPVVMVTKSEEERIMNEAIGKNIADYLVKPVNPTQVVAAAKKILESRRLQSDFFMREYVQKINEIRARLYGPMDHEDWVDIHQSLSQWDLELDRHEDEDLKSSHLSQKREFNLEFAKYIEREYTNWLANADSRPILSPEVIPHFVTPHLSDDKPLIFVLVDGMRLDQWLAVEPIIAEYHDITREYYYSILPTSTPFARNSIFSGMFPDKLAKVKPEMWAGGTSDERSLNRFEDEFLDNLLKRLRVKVPGEPKYFKIGDLKEGDGFVRKLASHRNVSMFAIVFNFLDILAHGRSRSRVLQQIAPDESAFRSLMLSWFPHSTLFEIVKYAAKIGATCVITSDHGTVLATRGTIAYGKKETSTNLRYKYGDNLNCDPNESLLIKNPERYRLPSLSLATTFLIAREDYYFVYPTNYHHYNRQFQNSFQHGGISLEEMIVPVCTLRPRS